MSYHVFLKDTANKLLVDCGNINEEQFEEDYEVYKEFREFLEDFPETDLRDIDLKNLNLDQLKKLLDCFSIVQKLSWIQSYFQSLEYKFLQEGVNNLEVVGENKQPKGYKVI